MLDSPEKNRICTKRRKTIANERKKTKRELNAEITGEKIFASAVELFSKHGFHKVTISDITAHAGVAKGSFYNYFDSKDEVLVEQFKKIDACYRSALGTLSEDASAELMLDVLLAAMADYCENVCGVGMIKVVYINQIGVGERKTILENDERVLFDIEKAIVRRGMVSGEIPDDLDEKLLTSLLSKRMRSLVFEWCLCDGTNPLVRDSALESKALLRSIVSGARVLSGTE